MDITDILYSVGLEVAQDQLKSRGKRKFIARELLKVLDSPAVL